MKDFNDEVETISACIGEIEEALVPLELSKYLVNSKIVNFDKNTVILDVYSSKHNLYECLSPDMYKEYISLDINQSIKYKDDTKVSKLTTNNINDISIDDKYCDIIFASANKICFGENHGSIFEFERSIKPTGTMIVDMSKYWYLKQFNQMIFVSRGWNLYKCLKIDYAYNAKLTSKYFCFYQSPKERGNARFKS